MSVKCLFCGKKVEPGPRVMVARQWSSSSSKGAARLASLHERCWGTVAHVLRAERMKREQSDREVADALEMAERFERLGAPS